jgi:hypothetical protein
MLGQLERAIELREQRRTVLRMREVDGCELEMRVRGRGLERFRRAGPGLHAGVVDDGKVWRFHSRILAKDW